MMKNIKKYRRSHVPFMLSAAILTRWGAKWLLVKPWTSSIGQYVQYCTGAPPRPSKWPAKLVHFFVVVLFAVALAAGGAIQSK
jgi:hypothetical protein